MLFGTTLRIPVTLNRDSRICEHHFRKACGQGFLEQKLSFEGRHFFDSPSKPAAKRSSCEPMGLAHRPSFDARTRVLSSPESVYTQAGISVHFKSEYANVQDQHTRYTVCLDLVAQSVLRTRHLHAVESELTLSTVVKNLVVLRLSLVLVSRAPSKDCRCSHIFPLHDGKIPLDVLIAHA